MLSALDRIGRLGPSALAIVMTLAILTPPVGTALRPYVSEAVFALLVIAFLRTEPSALIARLARPALPLAAALWGVLLLPALFVAGLHWLGPSNLPVWLALGLVLQLATVPMMAAPALATLAGLDATLALAGLAVASVLGPITAPLLLAASGLPASIEALDLAARLLGIIIGSAAVGWLLRDVVGAARITARQDRLNGVNVIVLYVFLAAVVGDLGADAIAEPLRVAWLTALGFAVYGLIFALSFAVFLPAGGRNALGVAALTSQKNMGIVIAATAATLPDATWLYFAVSQFPICLAPILIARLARRL